MMRSRWAAVGAAVAVTLGAGGLGVARATLDGSDKPVYVSLEQPCRLVDTRPANQIGLKGTPIAAGEAEAYEIQVTGESGDCAGDDGPAVPASAVGVSLNVTAIAPSAPSGRSYFTVYPADAPLPGTSNLNFVDGQTPFPNKVDVGLSADGRIRIYNHDGTAHAAVDVFGYYVDHDHDDRYYTEDEVDGLVEASAAPPTVEFGQGLDWVSNAGNTSTVLIDEAGAEIDGGTGGTAHLSLVGPASVSGQPYHLVSATYCVESYGGTVSESSIVGLGNSVVGDDFEEPIETKDTTDRSGPGCYTLTAPAEVAERRSHHLMLYVEGAVHISEVTAIWSPAP